MDLGAIDSYLQGLVVLIVLDRHDAVAVEKQTLQNGEVSLLHVSLLFSILLLTRFTSTNATVCLSPGL